MGGGEAAREAAGMRWWLVGPIRGLSAGVDGQGVQVVGQDRPAGPDSLALVTLQPAAAQVVAALEVADAALAAGAVAGQPPAGAAVQLGRGLGQQAVLGGVARCGRRRQQVPRARRPVLAVTSASWAPQP